VRAFLALILLCRAAAGQENEPPPRERPARDAWLGARIDALIAARPELGTARIGVAVDDLATGRPLYRRAGDEPFNVASNVKVVTVGAALAVLGPEHRFRTVLLADAIDNAGTIGGNLYLRGGGDPSFDTPALWSLVHELRLIGVKKVTGALVIDDSFFDAATLPPAYEQKQEDAPFRAPVAAVSLNYNAVTVWVQPGTAAGAPARIVVSPPQDYVTVRSTVTTVAAGRTALASTSRSGSAGLEVDVAGQIRLDDLGGEAVRKRVDSPAAYTAAALRAFLVQAGIRVGPTRYAAVPKSARALVTHTSEPVAVLVRELSKFSNNFMAETLLKAMGAEAGGAPGTWPKGLAAATGWLASAGLERGQYRYENGSGLYDSNRFTPAQIARVLRAGALDPRFGPEYQSALAIAGADGTLARRMAGGPAERVVRGKSGTLKNVSCLSGLAGGRGAPLAFALLVNELPETAAAARAVRGLEDGVAEALALYVDADR
jgi:D-alanyl-D-alanine carboxypeptidase/D-alanyl-D-alanine-endopeptidase (penicillin-binding protein 4)